MVGNLDDMKIIELFFERSEQAIIELSNKYGSACSKVAFNILNDKQDTEECVNDAYLGTWNTIQMCIRDSVNTALHNITF